MDRTDGSDEGQPSPPARVFERLAQLSGYTWDQSFGPFHSVSGEKYAPSQTTVTDPGSIELR